MTGCTRCKSINEDEDLDAQGVCRTCTGASEAELDKELASRYAWFIKNNRGRMAWRLGYDKLELASEDPDDPENEEVALFGYAKGRRYKVAIA